MVPNDGVTVGPAGDDGFGDCCCNCCRNVESPFGAERNPWLVADPFPEARFGSVSRGLESEFEGVPLDEDELEALDELPPRLNRGLRSSAEVVSTVKAASAVSRPNRSKCRGRRGMIPSQDKVAARHGGPRGLGESCCGSRSTA